jgi:hypothetical protein
MTNIHVLHPPESAPPEPPLLTRIKRNGRLFAAFFAALLALALVFAVALAGVVLFYDGDQISFGPGGVWFGRGPDAAAGRVALSTFSGLQRTAGAVAGALLVAPTAYILFQLRALFRLYAQGVVFALENALRLKRLGLGLLGYALAPFCANRIAWLVGVSNDPTWFHLYEIQAAVIGGLLFVIADVMQHAHEIEKEKEGFI